MNELLFAQVRASKRIRTMKKILSLAVVMPMLFLPVAASAQDFGFTCEDAVREIICHEFQGQALEKCVAREVPNF